MGNCKIHKLKVTNRTPYLFSLNGSNTIMLALLVHIDSAVSKVCFYISLHQCSYLAAIPFFRLKLLMLFQFWIDNFAHTSPQTGTSHHPQCHQSRALTVWICTHLNFITYSSGPSDARKFLEKCLKFLQIQKYSFWTYQCTAFYNHCNI